MGRQKILLCDVSTFDKLGDGCVTTSDVIMLGWVHSLKMPCNDASDLIPDKMRGPSEH